MNVIELSLRVDAESAEALAAAFNEYAYGGAVIEQVITPEQDETLDAARPYTVRAFLLKDETLAEKQRAIERAVWAYSMLRPVGELETRELAEEDYAHAWKKFYPVPTSKAVMPRVTYFSSSAKHKRVVGCKPVPNAMPGSSSITISSARGV